MARMNVNPNNTMVKRLMGIVQHYYPDKYWRRREIVVDSNNKTSKLVKLYYLYYIKNVMLLIMHHLELI